MKKLFAITALFGSFCLLALAKDTTLVGRIGDAKCGNTIIASCVNKCWSKGSGAILVTKDGTKYAISNKDSVKDDAGALVQLSGTLKDKTITVSSVKVIKPAADAKAKPMGNMKMGGMKM